MPRPRHGVLSRWVLYDVHFGARSWPRPSSRSPPACCQNRNFSRFWAGGVRRCSTRRISIQNTPAHRASARRTSRRQAAEPASLNAPMLWTVQTPGSTSASASLKPPMPWTVQTPGACIRRLNSGRGTGDQISRRAAPGCCKSGGGATSAPLRRGGHASASTRNRRHSA